VACANNPFEGLRIEGSLPGEGRGGSATLAGSPAASEAPPESEAARGGAGRGSAGQQGRQAEGPAGVARIAARDGDEQGDQADGGRRTGGAGSGQGEQSPSETAQASGGAPGAPADQSAPQQATLQAGQPGGSPSGDSGQRSESPRRDGVPMVRPIRLYVAADRVVVLPDQAQSPTDGALAASNPQRVDFQGATSEQINELIAALKRHADSWGIAGLGMYWDPRLVLNVTSDGVRRADEVRRLLEAAGLKVQAYPVATASQPGGDRATR